MLGDKAIKKAMRDGRIVIDPFDEDHLGPNSYDLRIGNWICRQRYSGQMITPDGVENLVSPKPFSLDTERVQGTELWASPENVDRGIILLEPGELILAHTDEVVGTHGNIVGEMKSRSSAMRCGFNVCIDAGLGDVGFHSRWTMEIYNHTHRILGIPVGMRVAQMTFYKVKGVSKNYVDKGGTYGNAAGEWTPEDMIPRSTVM